MRKVDLESPVPKYYQIKDILKEMILSGKLKEGEKLDTCRKMAEDFETTYLTINHAIGLLDKEKLIRRVQGKGIFVDKKELKPLIPRKVHALMTYRGEVYGDIFSSFLAAMDKTDFRIEATDLLSFNNLSYAEQEERLNSIMSGGPLNLLIDGDYSFPLKLLAKQIDKINQITFIHRYEKDFRLDGVNYILTDYFNAGYSVGKHLISKGHTRILFITFGYPPKSATPKWIEGTYHHDIGRGIQAAMKEHGLDDSRFSVILENSPDRNERLASYLKNNKFPGILCCGDFLVLDVYNLAFQNKLEIGKDLSVAGFFNTGLAQKFSPALTSVSINADELGRLAAETIKNDDRNKNISVKTKLVIRQSA